MGSNEERSLISERYNRLSIDSSENVDKLKKLLHQESRHHQETENCYDTLQKEYDALLFKYAEAENTIDKLRIGAKVDLYSDGPGFVNAKQREYHPRCKSAQQILLPQGQHANMSRTYSLPDHQVMNKSCEFIPEENTETSQLEAYLRLKNLQDDVNAFQSALADQDYDEEEQKQLYDIMIREFNDIKNELDDIEKGKVNREKLDDDLDQTNLQHEIQGLGLQLEEINDEISEQINNKQRKISERNKVLRSTNLMSASITDDVFIPDAVDSHDQNNNQQDDEDNTAVREQGREEADEFQSKYLSTSSEVPNQHYIASDHHVGSWIASHHSTASEVERKPNQVSSRRFSYSSRHKQNYSPKHSIEPTRPNTMNSTEDSGFIDGNHPSAHKNQPTTMENPAKERLLIHHHAEIHQPSVSARSSGEEYRRKLDSLRGFIREKRNASTSVSIQHSPKSTSPLTSAKKTPRSWVRGVAPKSYHQDINARTPDTRKLYLCANNKSGSYVEKRSPRNSIASSFEEVLPNDSTYEDMNTSRHIERPYTDSAVVESLHEEMQGIRDLVLDMRSILPAQSSISYPRQSSTRYKDLLLEKSKNHRKSDSYQTSPKRGHKSPSQRYKSPPQGRKVRSIGTNHNQNNNPPEHFLLNQQRSMLENLEKKIDDLSNKIEDHVSSKESSTNSSEYDKSKTQNSELLSSSDRDDNRVLDTDVTFPNDTLELADSTELLTLQNLSRKVDELSLSINRKKDVSFSLPKPLSDRSEQKRLAEKLERKLFELNETIKSSEPTQKAANQSVKHDSKDSTIHVVTCQICDEDVTYSHNASHSIGNDTHGWYDRQNRLFGSSKVHQHNSKNSDSQIPFTSNKSTSTPYTEYQEESNRIRQDGDSRYENNTFHHYHTFYDMPDQHRKPSPKRTEAKKRHPERRELEYSDHLNASIVDASYAAQQMESISKKMLKNIAHDLFYAGPSEF